MSFKMKTNYAHNPADIEHYSTTQMREEFVMDKLFSVGDVLLTYTYNDRMIFGGVTPGNQVLEIKLDKELGVDYFLQRRELGIINIGGKGYLTIDDEKIEMVKHDGYYVGMGTKQVLFGSEDISNPAKFYVVSTPAHKTFPNKKLSFADALKKPLGDQKHINKRTIYKYIDATQMDTCQLQMGYTVLEPGSSWNTMPAHTHARRMETYMYFEFEEPDTKVFHFMGVPKQTKHVVLNNEQAVINPSWSIHCGVATTRYSFIWAMCGENQTYDDMDSVAMNDLR
ncbi:5-dehydro-4-deoxy-D-glucuronate isomerase [Lactobacillus sp. UCMA15818]|uniref:5-dehydro-4-deoxy-D-glucuronate isomerase n=1 Tax=Lactobacillus sp. UCMA15818 TaxID=2583394 RepID=UPI0025B08CE5|nr:5-dehydro-4-deoxy-D-glucuronate isomerase [Lactobacillus sp. UCMA15818]MDN2453156.1 5-dehydro-4-deoxy-D-glucuronate isomerase [Lactobacillus sp. UCMA15818]